MQHIRGASLRKVELKNSRSMTMLTVYTKVANKIHYGAHTDVTKDWGSVCKNAAKDVSWEWFYRGVTIPITHQVKVQIEERVYASNSEALEGAAYETIGG